MASVRKTFSVPYRPSANYTHRTGTNAGTWWSVVAAKCYNGKAVNTSWNFASLGIALPENVVIGVQYNTSHYGPHPIGEAAACYTSAGGCPYDSLNIAFGPRVTVGSKPYPDTVFQSTSDPSQLCDSTPTLGVLNLDSPTSACWTGTVPAIKVTATSTAWRSGPSRPWEGPLRVAARRPRRHGHCRRPARGAEHGRSLGP